jgi:membrane-associated HD superfamily phosphohydrolase
MSNHLASQLHWDFSIIGNGDMVACVNTVQWADLVEVHEVARQQLLQKLGLFVLNSLQDEFVVVGLVPSLQNFSSFVTDFRQNKLERLSLTSAAIK